MNSSHAQEGPVNPFCVVFRRLCAARRQPARTAWYYIAAAFEHGDQSATGRMATVAIGEQGPSSDSLRRASRSRGRRMEILRTPLVASRALGLAISPCAVFPQLAFDAFDIRIAISAAHSISESITTQVVQLRVSLGPVIARPCRTNSRLTRVTGPGTGDECRSIGRQSVELRFEPAGRGFLTVCPTHVCRGRRGSGFRSLTGC